MPAQKTSTSAIAMIMAHAAALEHGQYIAPSDKAPDGFNPVGTLNDDQRRLATLASMTYSDMYELQQRIRRLKRQVSAATRTDKNPLTSLRNLILGGLKPEVLDELETAQNDLILKTQEHKAIDALLWLDIKTTFRDGLAGKEMISVVNDWTVGWIEPRELNFGGARVQIIGAMPPGFEELFAEGGQLSELLGEVLGRRDRESASTH